MTVIQNMQRFSTAILQRSQLGGDFSGLRIFRLPLMKKAPAACSITIYTFFLFFILFVAAAFISFFCFSSRVTTKTSLPWSSICFGQELSVTSLVHDHMSSIDYFYLLQFIFLVNNSERKAVPISENHRKTPRPIVVPLNCSARNLTQTCPGNYPTTFDTDLAWKPVCPDYFRWIHEDLKPWKTTGISRDMVERAKRSAHFRLVIVKGKVYIEKYKKSIQTRDVFTIWGILQLLRRYPGKLLDLELTFDCNDRPVIRSGDHRGPNSTSPPPLFRYCGDRWTLDVVFPDWSFWGW